MLENTSKQDLNKTLWVRPEYLEKNRKWYIIDLKWVSWGRAAVEIAKLLIWKEKAYYNKFWDGWDFVIVINASKIKVTWNKLADKKYYTHSGHKWHLKEINLERLLVKKPEDVINFAVRWMLPKNTFRAKRLKRLKVFTWTTDQFDYLSPEQITIDDK